RRTNWRSSSDSFIVGDPEPIRPNLPAGRRAGQEKWSNLVSDGPPRRPGHYHPGRADCQWALGGGRWRPRRDDPTRGRRDPPRNGTKRAGIGAPARVSVPEPVPVRLARAARTTRPAVRLEQSHGPTKRSSKPVVALLPFTVLAR